MFGAFDSVWGYDYDENRFVYDCKYYVKENKLFDLYNDMYIRDLDEWDIEAINNYKKQYNIK